MLREPELDLTGTVSSVTRVDGGDDAVISFNVSSGLEASSDAFFVELVDASLLGPSAPYMVTGLSIDGIVVYANSSTGLALGYDAVSNGVFGMLPRLAFNKSLTLV